MTHTQLPTTTTTRPSHTLSYTHTHISPRRNEILANVLKEENRQRLLMASILKLLDKNR
jgi:hypothetical protein